MFLLIVYDRIDTRRTVPPNDKECDGRNGPCACRYFDSQTAISAIIIIEVVLLFEGNNFIFQDNFAVPVPWQCSGPCAIAARVQSARTVRYCSGTGTVWYCHSVTHSVTLLFD